MISPLESLAGTGKPLAVEPTPPFDPRGKINDQAHLASFLGNLDTRCVVPTLV
jgi:hypothetical protein